MILNSLLSHYRIEAIKWVVVLITVYIIRDILIRNPNTIDALFKSFWIASCIHVFFILLQFVLPDIVNVINSMLFNIKLTTLEIIREGEAVKGINAQSALAGLIATVFVGFIASDMVVIKKKRIKQIIPLLLGILSIILTLKRSFLISAILGLYFLIFIAIWDRRSTRVFKLTAISFLLIIGFLISVEIIPQLQEMVARTMRVGRALSGREQMFSHMWQIFRENPIFGIGNGYAEAIYSYGSHNVYLQLLAESGMVGFALFILVFVGQFARNIKISIGFIRNVPHNNPGLKPIYTSLYMQIVFFFYCLTGNPIYDYQFLVLFIVFFITPELEIRRFLL